MKYFLAFLALQVAPGGLGPLPIDRGVITTQHEEIVERRLNEVDNAFATQESNNVLARRSDSPTPSAPRCSVTECAKKCEKSYDECTAAATDAFKTKSCSIAKEHCDSACTADCD